MARLPCLNVFCSPSRLASLTHSSISKVWVGLLLCSGTEHGHITIKMIQVYLNYHALGTCCRGQYLSGRPCEYTGRNCTEHMFFVAGLSHSSAGGFDVVIHRASNPAKWIITVCSNKGGWIRSLANMTTSGVVTCFNTIWLLWLLNVGYTVWFRKMNSLLKSSWLEQ